MNVLDNTAFDLEMRGVSQSESRRQTMVFLDEMGMADFVGSFPHELSGWETLRTEDLYATLIVIAALGITINWLIRRLTVILVPWQSAIQKNRQ